MTTAFGDVAFGGKADIKLTRKRLEPVKEKRAGARPDRGGASARLYAAHLLSRLSRNRARQRGTLIGGST